LLQCFIALITKVSRCLIQRQFEIVARPFDFDRFSCDVADHLLPVHLETRDTRLPRTMRTRRDRRLNTANGALLILNDIDLADVQQLHESDILREKIGIDDGVLS
jgi:hypothetical protein